MSDMSELFSRDPLDLSEQDLDAIIEIFRTSRKQFNMGNAKAGSTKALTPKQKEAEELSSKLSLDLDL